MAFHEDLLYHHQICTLLEIRQWLPSLPPEFMVVDVVGWNYFSYCVWLLFNTKLKVHFGQRGQPLHYTITHTSTQIPNAERKSAILDGYRLWIFLGIDIWKMLGRSYCCCDATNCFGDNGGTQICRYIRTYKNIARTSFGVSWGVSNAITQYLTRPPRRNNVIQGDYSCLIGYHTTKYVRCNITNKLCLS